MNESVLILFPLLHHTPTIKIPSRNPSPLDKTQLQREHLWSFVSCMVPAHWVVVAPRQLWDAGLVWCNSGKTGLLEPMSVQYVNDGP